MEIILESVMSPEAAVSTETRNKVRNTSGDQAKAPYFLTFC